MKAANNQPSYKDDPDGALQIAVGERLREAREKRGWTQRALAERAGVHDVHISRLEAGLLDARLSTLRKVADALGLTIAGLFRGAQK